MNASFSTSTGTMSDIRDIAARFDLQGEILEVRPLGNGLINDTFMVVTTGGNPDYVLQRINHAIFKDVELLQHNIDTVTEYLRGKLAARGETDIDRKVLRYIHPKGSSKSYLFDGKSYWRVSVFIKDSYTYEAVTPEYSYFAGKAFGDFEAMLSDIPEQLGEPIPDFHNMELRARQLEDAVRADAAGRLDSSEARDILNEMRLHMDRMCKAERMYREGLLPKRICHCDTKVNNMLFDRDGKVLCVIDLDTMMPSFVFSDIGDFLRTAGSTLPEDDPQFEKVECRMDIYEAFIRGYLESMGDILTPVERENIPFAAQLFPFMQAVRFFTDYLNGDTYYRIRYPEHNLVRTKNQMALFHSMLAHEEQMAALL